MREFPNPRSSDDVKPRIAFGRSRLQHPGSVDMRYFTNPFTPYPHSVSCDSGSPDLGASSPTTPLSDVCPALPYPPRRSSTSCSTSFLASRHINIYSPTLYCLPAFLHPSYAAIALLASCVVVPSEPRCSLWFSWAYVRCKRSGTLFADRSHPPVYLPVNLPICEPPSERLCCRTGEPHPERFYEHPLLVCR